LLERIARNLRKLRAEAGLSQTGLARLSSVGRPVISRIENKQTDIQLTTLQKLARGLQIDVTELLD